MKKIYSSLLKLALCLSVSTSVNAQVFPESFEGAGFPPSAWTSFDNGIGTVRSWTTSAIAQNGLKAAYIKYEAVTGTAEDWLVSPTVTISAATATLSYWERESYATDYGSIYNVLVSTSSQTDVATFTTVATYPETTTNSTTYRPKLIDLSAYVGQTIYIAFRMDNNDGDDWLLDNIDLIGPCTTPPVAGVISGTTATNNGTTNNYSITPTTGNVQWYTGTTATGPWTAIAGATTAINQPITASGSGTVFLNVIASSSGCPDDTANIPFQVSVNFLNDVCDAISLPIGVSNTVYDLFGATVQTGEVSPPGVTCSGNNSWCNTTLDNTRWFSFVAPSSGYVTVQSPGFDTQLAIWKAASCSDLLSSTTATLLAANDDDSNYVAHGGVMFSSFVYAACLTPGTTYFIQLDSYSPATASNFTKVLVTDMGSPLDASFAGLTAVFCSTDVAVPLTPTTLGGVFNLDLDTTSITQFDPSIAGVGSHTVTYSVYGCTSSSLTTVTSCSVTGIKELSKTEVAIFPNPTTGILHISFSVELAANAAIEIFDALGRLIIKENLSKDITSINTSKLDNGLYNYKIINNNQTIKVGRFTKQ